MGCLDNTIKQIANQENFMQKQEIKKLQMEEKQQTKMKKIQDDMEAKVVLRKQKMEAKMALKKEKMEENLKVKMALKKEKMEAKLKQKIQDKIIVRKEKMDKKLQSKMELKKDKLKQKTEAKLKQQYIKIKQKQERIENKMKKVEEIRVKQELRISKKTTRSISVQSRKILSSDMSNKVKLEKLNGLIKEEHRLEIVKIYEILDKEISAFNYSGHLRCSIKKLSNDITDIETVNEYLSVVRYIQTKILMFIINHRIEDTIELFTSFTINMGSKTNDLDFTNNIYYITPELYVSIPVNSSNYELIEKFNHPLNMIYNRSEYCVNEVIKDIFSYRLYFKLDLQTYLNILRKGTLKDEPKADTRFIKSTTKYDRYQKLIERFNNIPKVLPKIGNPPVYIEVENDIVSDSDTLEDYSITPPITCEKVMEYCQYLLINSENKMKYYDIYDELHSIRNDKDIGDRVMELYKKIKSQS